MEATTLQGRLAYAGPLRRSCALVGEDGRSVDFYSNIDAVLTAMAGKQVRHESTLDTFSLVVDEESDLRLHYADGHLTLQGVKGSGFRNLSFYLSEMLQRLNGRLIHVAITDGAGLIISPDPSEEVFGVKWFSANDRCRIPRGAEYSVCGMLSSTDRCLFLVTGVRRMECAKFDGDTAQRLLASHHDRLIQGVRIGRCALLGRET